MTAPSNRDSLFRLNTSPTLRGCGCPYDGRDLCDVHGDGTGYCPACGQYAPMTLDGAARVHHCDRTPPACGLPPNIYVCPRCYGHGIGRLGCWGTQQRPHAHCYMQPVVEVIQGRCSCSTFCGDRDVDGPGTCKGLDRA